MTDDDQIAFSLREFVNRRKYTSFDLETIASIPDDDIELAIQDYVFWRIGDDFANEGSVLASLSPAFRAIYTTLHVESEVFNGGFNQYFWNSEGKLARAALEGFHHIGAPEYADLMRRAIAAWQAEQPETERFREIDTLEAFSESYEHSGLGRFDDEFDELAKVSNLSKLRAAFIRSHPAEFVTQ